MNTHIRHKNGQIGGQNQPDNVTRLRTPLERFRDNPTRKSAIDAACCLCVGGPKDPGWQTQIRECTATPESRCPCPLWLFRPYK